jgi:hypothetical protein|tara:strand:- start:8526 stop:9308 length:783 start_codon:yes stop_codon:yes gene_type:complete
MSLTGKTPKDTYKDLLHTDNSNNGVDSTLRTIKSGNGNESSLLVSDRSLKVVSNTNNTSAFLVNNASDAEKFKVDTTNDQVKALGTHVHTQYAHFGMSPHDSSSILADRHVGVPFENNFGTSLYPLYIGTGTDPDTSFTTANSNNQRASTLSACMWYVPSNISIDAVYSVEGADAASGDTTNMHLMSYTFNSGSTSALADGTLLAHSADRVNAGSEQAYLSTWTIDSASVAAGKIILATFRQDGTNSDYTVNITVKYHLT